MKLGAENCLGTKPDVTGQSPYPSYCGSTVLKKLASGDCSTLYLPSEKLFRSQPSSLEGERRVRI